MPSSPRSAQIDLATTPFYHCVSRCVRRAFLCGADDYDGANYDHRKPWFIERLKFAADIFAIDVCAYAVLSNHYHVVLRVDADRGLGWSDEAVLRRYGRLFRYAARAARDLPAALRQARVAVFRERLTDVSWFMRIVNEHIARRANKEDKCTGRFWEGRFRSQPLLDDAAVYTCMSYVDLNPVRAGMASSLDDSEFTSIQQRLRQAAGSGMEGRDSPSIALAPLRGEGRRGGHGALEMSFRDYVELLEWTGRAAGAKAGGRIRGAPPEVLARLGINASAWLATMVVPGLAALTTLGGEASMSAEAERRGRKWLKGQRKARALFDDGVAAAAAAD